MKKERLDVLITQKGFFDSREKSKRAIMAGVVMVDGQRVDKAGTEVKIDSEITIKENPIKYVSRGGLKLEKAIKEYGIRLENCVCMDIGASTGGFTDCMLQNGASKVFSVDVGYGQLDWKLRNEPKVVNMERTNIRSVTLEQIGEKLDFVSIDVSFISLKKVIPVAYELLRDGGEIVFLIKPQFEAGRENVGKHGVVRDIKIHDSVVNDLVKFAAEFGFLIKKVTFSPIKGPKGNIEYLCYAEKKLEPQLFGEEVEAMARGAVESSHRELAKKQ
jgi:23S rRNA (cytidine1920-2'-O)/16S rRNA (cytidine1409-2'-O)-methyltransferase